jgi:hypothetical protein
MKFVLFDLRKQTVNIELLMIFHQLVYQLEIELLVDQYSKYYYLSLSFKIDVEIKLTLLFFFDQLFTSGVDKREALNKFGLSIDCSSLNLLLSSNGLIGWFCHVVAVGVSTIFV